MEDFELLSPSPGTFPLSHLYDEMLQVYKGYESAVLLHQVYNKINKCTYMHLLYMGVRLCLLACVPNASLKKK